MDWAYLIYFAIIAMCGIVCGGFIEFSIKAFKKQSYFWFGANLTYAITFIAFIMKLVSYLE